MLFITLQPGMSPVYGGGPPGGGPPGPGSSTPIMPSPQDSNTSSGDNMYPMMKPTSAMSGVSIVNLAHIFFPISKIKL